MKLTIYLVGYSTPWFYYDVIGAYVDGDYYVIRISDKLTYRHPTRNIIRIEEAHK
jgi:hypothetical protein